MTSVKETVRMLCILLKFERMRGRSVRVVQAYKRVVVGGKVEEGREVEGVEVEVGVIETVNVAAELTGVGRVGRRGSAKENAIKPTIDGNVKIDERNVQLCSV